MAKGRTKAIRAFFKMLGYDLRRLEKFHIHDVDSGESLGRVKGFDAFEAILPWKVESFDILFRSCARVELFGQSRLRLLDAPKSEVLLRCLNSIVASINHARDQGLETPITLTILDDHSDRECLGRAAKILARATCPTRLVSLDVTGNGPSVGANFRYGKANCKDIIYFVEDDYLHDLPAVLELVQSYETLAGILDRDIILHPADRSGCYRHVEATRLILGSHRHWRNLVDLTGTFVTTREFLGRYWKHYIGLERYGVDEGVTEKNTLDLILQEVPCLTPVPSLAVHFQQFDEMSPFVDWRAWWERAGQDLQ